MGVRFGAAKRGFWRGEVAGSSTCEWLKKDRAGWSIAGFWYLHSISLWSMPGFQAVLGGPKCTSPPLRAFGIPSSSTRAFIPKGNPQYCPPMPSCCSSLPPGC